MNIEIHKLLDIQEIRLQDYSQKYYKIIKKDINRDLKIMCKRIKLIIN